MMYMNDDPTDVYMAYEGCRDHPTQLSIEMEIDPAQNLNFASFLLAKCCNKSQTFDN